MDNKLVIQLLKSKTEEIQSLLEHSINNPADLTDSIELLEARINGLSQDFKILKKNSELNQVKTIIASPPEEIVIDSKESVTKEIEIIDVNDETKELIENVITDKLELEDKKQEEVSIVNKSVQAEPIQLIGETRSTQKLTDIQSAIGINDRFLFTRELFENNIDEYNTAISFINKSDSYASVINWIKAEKEWDLEDPTVAQFIEITKRKF